MVSRVNQRVRRVLTKVSEDNQSINKNHDVVLSSGALPPPVFSNGPRPVQRIPAVERTLHSGTLHCLPSSSRVRFHLPRVLIHLNFLSVGCMNGRLRRNVKGKHHLHVNRIAGIPRWHVFPDRNRDVISGAEIWRKHPPW